MSDAPTPPRSTGPAPDTRPRSLTRRQEWRRRQREARERLSAAWNRLRSLDTRPAWILAIVLGVGTGVVLYEAWLTSLAVAIIIGLAITMWVFLGPRLRVSLDQTNAQFQGWAQPRRKWLYPLLGVGGAVLAGLLPFINDWFVVPDWVFLATNGSILFKIALFSLFALGLNVVVGFAGLLDLGYVAFWAIGAYTAGIMSGAAKFSLGLNHHPPTVTAADKPVWHEWMWLILLAALVTAVLAGVLLGSPTLRLRGDYLAIVTLGFGEIVRITANNLDSITVGPRGIGSIPHPAIPTPGQDIVWGTLTDDKYYWLALAFVVLWIVAIRMLDNSRIGRAWVAIREDEVAAAAMGVPVVRMKLAAFAIGACTAGVGGVLYSEQINAIAPSQFQLIYSILILAMVVIGGMGSIGGAILGATIVTLIPEVFRGITAYRYFIFGIAIIVVMIFRPQGLLPSKRRKAELRGGHVSSGGELYEAMHAGN
jgi:branched-chain amino acid transport system permease protein